MANQNYLTKNTCNFCIAFPKSLDLRENINTSFLVLC